MHAPEQSTTALVVGASGMLAECVRWCSQRHDRVVATCRSDASAAKLRSLSPNVAPVRADWSRPDSWWQAVSDTVGGSRVELAVVWMHSTAGELHQRIHTLVPDGGLVVRVRGHATVKPGDGELAPWIDGADPRLALPLPNERHVVLGWKPERSGRWLTSDEIATGVVQLLERWLADDAAPPVAWVGSVRPWSSRPPGWG